MQEPFEDLDLRDAIEQRAGAFCIQRWKEAARFGGMNQRFERAEGLLAQAWAAEPSGAADYARGFARLGKLLPPDWGGTLVLVGDGLPACGLREPSAVGRPRFVRRATHLPRDVWARLRERARRVFGYGCCRLRRMRQGRCRQVEESSSASALSL